MRQLSYVFLTSSLCMICNGQTNIIPEFADPSNQALALLDWTSGIRIFYCTDSPLDILVEPFKQALIQSLNKFCRNATACGLVKSIKFKPDYVVLLDGYPKRNYGAVQFRFVIVLPPNAVSMDPLTKPLLTKQILSNFLNKSIEEFERRLGWKVSSYEQFPKFDSITEFMNKALIPIGFTLLILMLLIAYWSTIISRSSGGGEGWFTRGSKRAAMKRTLEIIEQQKILFAEIDGRNERHCDEFPRVSVQIVPNKKNYDNVDTSNKEITKEYDKKFSTDSTLLQSKAIRSESISSTQGSIAAFRNVGGGRPLHQRQSSIDDGNLVIKKHRKKRITSRSRRLAPRQWKLTSMALSGFGKPRRF